MLTHRGFTLIELLVVVTIIVVLLALLAPALDQAIYQAELASCGANLKGIATGAGTYAVANARHYPYRKASKLGPWKRPNLIASTEGAGIDDRPLLMPYMSMDMLLDPLNGGIDLDPSVTHRDSHVFANYPLWFGNQYHPPEGGRGMHRLGDWLEWNNVDYRVIASDWDVILPGTGLHASHPDADGLMWHAVAQDQAPVDYKFTGMVEVDGRMTISRWVTTNGRSDRGTLDTNYAFTDGSVKRFPKVAWNEAELPDGRTNKVPTDFNRTSWPTWWVNLPPR